MLPLSTRMAVSGETLNQNGRAHALPMVSPHRHEFGAARLSAGRKRTTNASRRENHSGSSR
jgi:hypothetical protein